MSVTVDSERLPVEELGLTTVGQVLSHLQRENKLVVHVLLDGEEPDLHQVPALRAAPLLGHTLYIETTDPSQMADEVFDAVLLRLEHTDAAREEAVGLIQANQVSRALEKLAGCFSAWQAAQESMEKVAELLKLDLGTIVVDGQPLFDILGGFARQLREIRTSLENRDYVALCDALQYEAAETTRQWREAIGQLKANLA